MNTPNNDVTILINAARAAAEAFLAALDHADPVAPVPPAAPRATRGEPVAYDPLHDVPPFHADPSKTATDEQHRMAWVTYLGAIGRINAEEGRGATSKEVSELARKAGYSGGNAVNGWNSRPGSPRAIELIDGGRFLNDAALGWIRKDAGRLGIELTGEYSTVPQPR